MRKTKTQRGQIHIYTGDGKGKTTAALGLALRALGQGLKVGIIFFDKGGDYYGEKKILDQLKTRSLQYKFFGQPRITTNHVFRFPNTKQDFQQAQLALAQSLVWLQKDFDLLILDEINSQVKTSLLKLNDLLYLLKQKSVKMELVLTGRSCPRAIINQADLVTEMKMKKHYFNKGLVARKGIEF
jgi:cob(I)alamin adenosyltransferase